jgi:Type II secretion system protein B
MSYILDAMARAHTARTSEIGMRALSKRTLWQTIVIGVLLALVILLGTAYVDTLRNERTKPPVAAASGVSEAQAVPATTDIPSMAPRPSRQTSAPAAAGSAAPAEAVATTRPAGRPGNAPTKPNKVARFSSPSALSQPLPGPSPLGPGGTYVAAPSLPAGGVAPRAASEAPRTMTLAGLKPLSALPPDVRAVIAQMKVRVLFYAPQRRSRFVLIDSREVREGDDLFDGLRLEEITDNGLVIRHKDMLVLAPALAAR